MMFVGYYSIEKFEFEFNELEGIGKQFVQALTDVVWYIDGQYYKFENWYKLGKVPPVPGMFERFNKGSDCNKGGYNDWITKNTEAS